MQMSARIIATCLNRFDHAIHVELELPELNNYVATQGEANLSLNDRRLQNMENILGLRELPEVYQRKRVR